MIRAALLALVLALAWSPSALAAPDRRLVILQEGSAWILPELDHTVYQPQRYVLRGDVAHLRGLEGLPVRLAGRWTPGEVTLRSRLDEGPSALHAPAGATRGRLQGEVLSRDPPQVRLAMGGGRHQDVNLQWEGPPPAIWATMAAGSLCTVEATVAGSEAMDVRLAPPRQDHARRGPVRVLAQLGESFLQAALTRFRNSQPQAFQWTDPEGRTRLAVSDLGVTLLDCTPGQVRLYGSLTGATRLLGHQMPRIEGHWEVLSRPTLVGAELEFELVPDSLRLRLTRPLALALPAEVSANLQALLAAGLARGFRVPVPGAYWKDLVSSGAVRASDLSRMEVLTLPTGDRRTGLVVVAGPTAPGVRESGPDLFRDRLREPGGFAVALSAEAMSDVLKRQVPSLLPLRQTLPPQARVRQPVLFMQLEIDAVEITELQLDYRALQGRGVLGIQELVAHVHWKLGPFSGWEPGARLRGVAGLESRPGPPLSLVFRPELERIEFLSRHLRSRGTEEQEHLRRQIAEGLRAVPLDVLLPSHMPVTALGPGAVLELLDFQPWPEELVLQGRWILNPPPGVRTEGVEAGLDARKACIEERSVVGNYARIDGRMPG